MMSNALLDAFHAYNLRSFPNIDPPILMTPVVDGVTGSTEYSYGASFETLDGETPISDIVTVTNGNATLTSGNRVKLQISSYPAAVRNVKFFKNISGTYKLLGEATPVVGYLFDVGQATTAVEPVTENTSGRAQYQALGYHPGEWRQRQEGIDDQAIQIMADQNNWDTVFKDGDIIEGLVETLDSGTTWNFTPGKIYMGGRIHVVDSPDGGVELVGTGEEVVGLTPVISWVTPSVDPILTASADEHQPSEHSADGADRLVITFTWGVDVAGQIEVKRFIDNSPKVKTLPIERTILDQKIAQGIYDVSGHFVLDKFGFQIEDHATDETLLNLKLTKGIAYPSGYKVQFDGDRRLPFAKARDVLAVNNSGLDVFNSPGGYVITTEHEDFAVDGLSIKLKIGGGNYHTVTFTGTNTAAQLETAIESAINAYPTSGYLVSCTASDEGYLEIQALNGKSLEIATVADDAYTIMGLTPGVYKPIGTRIYPVNNTFIKTVTDLSYQTIIEAEDVTFNCSLHKNLLSHENVVAILGASDTAADCADGKFDYILDTDFIKDGNFIDFSTLGGSQPTGGATFFVKYEANQNAAKGTRQKILVVDAQVTKGAEDGVDDLTFTGATSKTKVLDGSAVTMTGDPSDVIEILRVNNTAGQSQTQYSLPALVKNSDALEHGTSQISWASAGGQGTGLTGQPVTSATYYVTYYIWKHALEGDYVSADSFDMYAEIETYASHNLRDYIDFRTSGGVRPAHGESTTLDYEYYLSRVDKLVVDSFGDFQLITGTAALLPPTPPDQTNVLSLAVLRISPYTYSKSDVTVVSVEPLRISQIGLQRMADSLDQLRYETVKLNHANETASQDVQGTVSGFFVDSLIGYAHMDLQFDKGGIKHDIALDRYNQCVLLPASQDQKVITVDMEASSKVRLAGNSLILDYQPVIFQSQPYASVTVNGASDYEYTNYYGHMRLTPSVDAFIDQTQAPLLNIDDANNELAPLIEAVTELGYGDIQWGDWTTLWTSRDHHNVTAGQERTGTKETLIPGTVTRDLGNRVVDMSLQGMMRVLDSNGDPFEIQVDIDGLLPNVDHACTVNGTVVDLTYDSSPANAAGGVGTHTYSSKTTAVSANNGCLTAKFVMPSGVPIGSATISVFYYADPAISVAVADFYSAGFMQTNQQTVLGMPTVEKVSTEVTDSRTIGWTVGWVPDDPLAQSFPVFDEIKYISGVNLWFSSKDATRGYTIQLRNMNNGFPGSNILSSTTLMPDDIFISDDASAKTEFVFDHVLGFLPGQNYCFVGLPGGNNTNYNVWAAEVGGVDTLTAARINTQVAPGVLFHSPNADTWEPITKQDLKYELVESNFENDCQIVFDNLTGIQASLLVLQVQEFIAPGTNVTWAYSIDGKVTWVPFSPYIDVDLQAIISQVCLRVDVTSTGGSYQVIKEYAGIILLYHVASANYIGTNETFTDPLAYPNRLTVTIDLLTDTTNGGGGRSVTPYYSTDDGETWTEIPAKVGYTPVITTEPYYRYVFETGSVTEFAQYRPRVYFETANRAVTPKGAKISFIHSRV